MVVELRDLRWAIVAGRHRSLRQAAETLNIRQSTLSRRLRDVEYRLGATLFERTNGGTRPTAAGQEFLEAAQRIIGETDTAFSRVKSGSSGKSGRLTIGVNTSMSAGNLRAILTEYQRRFPDVDIHTADGSHNRMLSDLAANAMDVAIMTTNNGNWDDRTLPLWSERVVIAIPEHHPLVGQSVVQWAELRDERLLSSRRDPGPELQHLLMVKLGFHGPHRIVEHEVGMDHLLSLVGAGLGLSLIFEGGTGAIYPGVIYREVHGSDGPTRLDFIACWRHANSNPTLVPFLGLLQERYPDLSVPNTGPVEGLDAGSAN